MENVILVQSEIYFYLALKKNNILKFLFNFEFICFEPILSHYANVMFCSF